MVVRGRGRGREKGGGRGRENLVFNSFCCYYLVRFSELKQGNGKKNRVRYYYLLIPTIQYVGFVP